MRKMWKKREGFTLIELLIVVAIIGILAGIAIPNFLGARSRARVARVFADFRTIGTALEAYYVDNAEYPSENAWAADPNPLTPDYITSIPDDPFNPGTAYRYYTDAAADAAGAAWLIVSDGPDGDADVADPTDWDDDDRVSGQLGGPDGAYSGYGFDNPDPSDKATNVWYDPTVGATSSGDLGRGGP